MRIRRFPRLAKQQPDILIRKNSERSYFAEVPGKKHLWHCHMTDNGPAWNYTTPDTEPWLRKKMLKRKWIRRLEKARHVYDARERKAREVLVRTEEAINFGRLDRLPKLIEEAASVIRPNGAAERTTFRWKDIPLASEAAPENLEWLAHARIPARQVTVIAAHKDSHKTMLMLALARAATTKGLFLGRPVKQVRVLYLNRDMPKAVFDSYCRLLGYDKSNRRFRILSSLWDTKYQPMQPDDPTLLRFARRYKPLIVFDHLIKFYDGRMDDAKAIDAFMEKLKKLAALGATVIILHHLPKQGRFSEGYGSVYIINGADFGWAIQRKGEKYGPAEQTQLEVTNTKSKMGEYQHFLIRPRLTVYRDYQVVNERSEEKENWDRDVKRVLRLFPKNDWREKKAARKEVMKQGMSRRHFQEIFSFCLVSGLLKLRTEAHNLKRVRRVASFSSLTAPIGKGSTGQTASQK